MDKKRATSLAYFFKVDYSAALKSSYLYVIYPKVPSEDRPLLAHWNPFYTIKKARALPYDCTVQEVLISKQGRDAFLQESASVVLGMQCDSYGLRSWNRQSLEGWKLRESIIYTHRVTYYPWSYSVTYTWVALLFSGMAAVVFAQLVQTGMFGASVATWGMEHLAFLVPYFLDVTTVPVLLGIGVGALWIAMLLGREALTPGFLFARWTIMRSEVDYYHCRLVQENLGLRRDDREDRAFQVEEYNSVNFLLKPVMMWIVYTFDRYGFVVLQDKLEKSGGDREPYCSKLYPCYHVPRLILGPFFHVIFVLGCVFNTVGNLYLWCCGNQRGKYLSAYWGKRFWAELGLLVCYILEAILNPFRFLLSAVHLVECLAINGVGALGAWGSSKRHQGYYPYAYTDTRDTQVRILESDDIACAVGYWATQPKYYVRNGRWALYLGWFFKQLVSLIFLIIKVPLYFGAAVLDGCYWGIAKTIYASWSTCSAFVVGMPITRGLGAKAPALIDTTIEAISSDMLPSSDTLNNNTPTPSFRCYRVTSSNVPG